MIGFKGDRSAKEGRRGSGFFRASVMVMTALFFACAPQTSGDPICEADEVSCGDQCCPAGSGCVDGVCTSPCDGEACGTECCGVGQTCLDTRCCRADLVCEDACCVDGERCLNGECVVCEGPPCGDGCCVLGEVCFMGVCCHNDSICGDACCGADQVCEFDQCHRDCGDLTRCGEAEECCPADAVCYQGSCVVPSGPCETYRDCAEDEYCDPELDQCLPLSEIGECQYRPDLITGEFNEVVLLWNWTEEDVFTQPVVGNLSDDNGDGVIDDLDTPDIVFASFSGYVHSAPGRLRVLNGDDGTVLLRQDYPAIDPGSGIALADVDDDGEQEIVACHHSGGGLYVFENDGTLLWDIPGGCRNTGGSDRWSYPAVADLEGDGTIEIITDYTIISEGIVRCEAAVGPASGISPAAVPVDIDGDGDLEIVTGRRAMDENCNILWDVAAITQEGHPSVADLDLDGLPEVVVASGQLHILNGEDGTARWPARTIEGGSGISFASSIADFDGDGRPEIAQPGNRLLTLYDVDCLPEGDPAHCGSGRTDMIVWTYPTNDGSCCAGAAAFDFEGDGTVEIVYADEILLRVFRGDDATVLYEDERNSATLWEYPVIADVNNDDHAEIVVASENDHRTGTHQGIRVFGDSENSWVNTRRIWNQFAYSITNIEGDGTVPLRQEANWLNPELNNYRQNQLLAEEGLFAAPDLIITDTAADDSTCPDDLTLTVRVVNQGSSSAPEGLEVAFYIEDDAGVASYVGSAFTTRRLLPGESEVVFFPYPVPPGEEGMLRFHAIVDSESGVDLARECHEDNNQSDSFEGRCEGIG